jgi:hypothetical protein
MRTVRANECKYLLRASDERAKETSIFADLKSRGGGGGVQRSCQEQGYLQTI